MQVFGICESVCITKSSKNCFISFIVQAVFTSENSKEVIMYKRTIKMHRVWQYSFVFYSVLNEVYEHNQILVIYI